MLEGDLVKITKIITNINTIHEYINEANGSLNYAFSLAVACNNLKITKDLIALGADVHFNNDFAEKYCSYYHQVKILHYLHSLPEFDGFNTSYIPLQPDVFEEMSFIRDDLLQCGAIKSDEDN